MANRNAAFKDVMNELRGKIKEHSSSKYKNSNTEEDEESSEHEESEDEDEDEEDADLMAKEEPMGDDLCTKCDSKCDVKHKYCANCGTKR